MRGGVVATHSDATTRLLMSAAAALRRMHQTIAARMNFFDADACINKQVSESRSFVTSTLEANERSFGFFGAATPARVSINMFGGGSL
jgi:hypothetical protein